MLKIYIFRTCVAIWKDIYPTTGSFIKDEKINELILVIYGVIERKFVEGDNVR